METAHTRAIFELFSPRRAVCVAAGASRAPTTVQQKSTAESSGRAGAARACLRDAVEQVRAAAAGVAAPGSVCVDVVVPADASLAVAAGQVTFCDALHRRGS